VPELKNFVLGAVFGILAIPLLNDVIAIAEQSTQHICTKIAVETYKTKQSIPEADGNAEGGGCAIGFHYTENDEDIEEGDE
jgi:hypothetical protein